MFQLDVLLISTSFMPLISSNESNISSTSNWNILYVGGTGGANYSSIQSAINDASNGDVIFVYNGTYYEKVIVNKMINLIGRDRNNTIIDGGGSGNVLHLSVDNIKIENLTIKNSGNSPSDSGIYISSNNCYLLNNILKNNYYGIYSYNTVNNVIKNNLIFNNTYDGIRLKNSVSCNLANNIIYNNDLNGLSNIYTNYSDISNNSIFLNDGNGIWDYESDNSIIIGNNLSNNSNNGISIKNSNNSFYLNNKIWSNVNNGIRLHDECCYNEVINNSIFMSYCGIWLYDFSNHNSVMNNHLSKNTYGIFCTNSDYNLIMGNVIDYQNYIGFALDDYSSNNIISSNSILNNVDCGIWMSDDSINNILYHNNFFNNSPNAEDNSVNLWDNSYPAGGNYWEDYSSVDYYHGPNQDILGSDGFGDIPYNISGGSNQDLYPLINPYGSITNLNTGEVFPTIQSAIDDVDTLSGHTIYVKKGIYYGSIEIDKTIYLIGEDKNSTIIDGYYFSPGPIVRVLADLVYVSGFTLVNNSGPSAGLKIEANFCTITNNILLNNNIEGLGIYFSSYNNITNNDIISTNGPGLVLWESNHNYMTNNRFLNDGMFVKDSFNNIILNNTVNGKPLVYLEGTLNNVISEAGQAVLVNCSNITIQNVNASNTYIGVLMLDTINSTISGSTFSLNYYGIYFEGCTNNIIYNKVYSIII